MNATTLEKMRKMKFFGMHRALKINLESGKQEQYTPDEMIAQLIEAEWDDRQNRSIQRHITNARFRYKAAIEELHYHTDRNIDRNQVMRFAECSFINKHENILITGSTGIGKSYIASALGYQACAQGYKVMYHNTAKLFGVDIAKPDVAIGKNTKASIQSGIYFAQLGLMEKLIEHTILEYRLAKRPKIIGTGGFSHLFTDYKIFDCVVPELVLLGIKKMLELN